MAQSDDAQRVLRGTTQLTAERLQSIAVATARSANPGWKAGIGTSIGLVDMDSQRMKFSVESIGGFREVFRFEVRIADASTRRNFEVLATGFTTRHQALLGLVQVTTKDVPGLPNYLAFLETFKSRVRGADSTAKFSTRVDYAPKDDGWNDPDPVDVLLGRAEPAPAKHSAPPAIELAVLSEGATAVLNFLEESGGGTFDAISDACSQELSQVSESLKEIEAIRSIVRERGGVYRLGS